MRSFSLLVLLHKPPAGKKAGPGSRKNTDELWKQVEQPPLSGALTSSFVFYFFLYIPLGNEQRIAMLWVQREVGSSFSLGICLCFVHRASYATDITG